MVVPSHCCIGYQESIKRSYDNMARDGSGYGRHGKWKQFVLRWKKPFELRTVEGRRPNELQPTHSTDLLLSISLLESHPQHYFCFYCLTFHRRQPPPHLQRSTWRSWTKPGRRPRLRLRRRPQSWLRPSNRSGLGCMMTCSPNREYTGLRMW